MKLYHWPVIDFTVSVWLLSVMGSPPLGKWASGSFAKITAFTCEPSGTPTK